LAINRICCWLRQIIRTSRSRHLRRFDMVLDFPLPDAAAVMQLIHAKLDGLAGIEQATDWGRQCGCDGRSIVQWILNAICFALAVEAVTSSLPLPDRLAAMLHSAASQLVKNNGPVLAERLVAPDFHSDSPTT